MASWRSRKSIATSSNAAYSGSPGLGRILWIGSWGWSSTWSTIPRSARSFRLTPEDRDDLTAEVFLNFIKDEFAILHHFRGQSSLATYLTVVARRIAVRTLLDQRALAPLSEGATRRPAQDATDSELEPGERISNREEVDRLLADLQESEARVVRMYHLEGKSYQEISDTVGMPQNSIGPILSRARAKMRRASVNQPAR